MIKMLARMQVFFLSLVVGGVAVGKVEALQPQTTSWNRRNFLGQLVAGTGTAVLTSTTNAPIVWATTSDDTIDLSSSSTKTTTSPVNSRQRRSKTLRGGNEMSAATHDGTDLNDAESIVAGGLLDKMGLADVAGASSSSLDRRKAYGG